MNWNSSLPALPFGLSFPTVFEHSGYLYVIGGAKDTVVNLNNQVYRTSINGHSADTWTLVGTVPNLGYGCRGLAKYRDRFVFVVGGQNGGGTNQAGVLTLALNGSDVEALAETPMPLLPAAETAMTVLVVEDWLLVAGGGTGSTSGASIIGARIHADGSLDPWQTLSPLPSIYVNAAYPIFIHYNGFLYIGGGGGGSTDVPQIFSASFSQSGVVGPWSAGTGLPQYANRSAYALDKGFGALYICGGDSLNIGNSSTNGVVQKLVLGPGGTVASAAIIEPMPIGVRAAAAVFTSSGKLVVVGGNDVSTNFVRNVSVGQR